MPSFGRHSLLPLIALALPTYICGQDSASQRPASELADAIDRVQRNDLGTGPVDALSFVGVIADARAVQALPVLEQYYARTSDREIKPGVASALVRMGDKKDEYWVYLVTLARPAVESDAPDAFGMLIGESSDISPQFKAWAGAHSLSVEAAFKLVMQDLPARLAPLAKTGDPRGVPLLRKGLSSPNIMIATLAADGLAQAHDNDSIPRIIDACKRAPANTAHFFAESLLFFDDRRAENTFALYFPDVNIQDARKFRGDAPFGRLAKPE